MYPEEKGSTMEANITTAAPTNVTETTQNLTDIIVISTTEAPTTWPDLASSTKASQQDNGHNLLPIIGGILGAAALIVVLVLIVYCFCRRGKREKKIPPELPHPFAATSTGVELKVVFHSSTSRESSTSAQVQMVGYKPMSGAALLPPRKLSAPASAFTSVKDLGTSISGRSKSVSTSVMESESVYNNDEVVRASSASKPPAAIMEPTSGDQSRDSLYVRPSSWLSPDLSGKDEPSTLTQTEVEVSNISRRRMDSQKYLLPAELVLNLQNDIRKMSGSSLTGDIESQSPSGSSRRLRWKAKAPIIHSADEPNRKSSVYVCMDSGSQPNSPMRRSDSVAGSSSDGCTSPRPLPSPCRKTSNQSSYINLRQDSKTSDNSQPNSPVPDLYEPVSSLVMPSVYGNAWEIMKSQLPSSEAADDRNDPDTYRICLVPGRPTPLEEIVISEQDNNDKNAEHSDKETLMSDLVPDSVQSTENSGRDSVLLSYVNVAQFHKELSESEVSSVPTQENHQESECPKDEKIPEVKADPNLQGQQGKAKNGSQPKNTHKSKKPTTLPKPKNLKKKVSDSDSLAGTLASLQRTVRTSLKVKTKNRIGTKSSSSSPDMPPKAPRDPSIDPATNKSNIKQSSDSECQTISPQAGLTSPSAEETTEYRNLLPSSMAQNIEVENKLNANGSTQPAEIKVKANKNSPKTKPDTAIKKQNRKSNSLLRGKLDLSELRSKLKKAH